MVVVDVVELVDVVGELVEVEVVEGPVLDEVDVVGGAEDVVVTGLVEVVEGPVDVVVTVEGVLVLDVVTFPDNAA